MIKLAVCDDDEQFRKQIGKAAGNILFARGEYEITYFRNGNEVKQAVREHRFSCHLLLLDICMHPGNGLETASWIRRNKIDTDIIFITVSREHVYECYTYKAFAYLLKPVSIKKLDSELNRYLDEMEENGEYLNINIRGVEQKIPTGRILYFESSMRKIRIHLTGEIIEFYGKLDELEELLKEYGFLRCHQSYLVNASYVRSMKRGQLDLEGEQIPISRKYWDRIRQKQGGD